MRTRGFLVSVFAAFLLSACSTVEGVGKDITDIDNWFHGKPSAMEKTLGKMPTGYSGQNKGTVLKPSGLQAPSSAASADSLLWVEDYKVPQSEPSEVSDDMAPITSSAPAVEWNTVPDPAAPQPGVAYNKEVTLFPLDGEAPAYTYTSAPYASAGMQAPATSRNYDFYGQLVQQVYFAHGSSAIASADKNNLKELAEGVKRTANDDVSVTVVGHASKRVDGVNDPVSRKMINFEMAQKRANAVTQELKKSGINPAWVRTVSKGDDEPNLAPGVKTQEDADRRAEVYMNSK